MKLNPMQGEKKETIKIRAKINKIEKRKSRGKKKRWFFLKINKLNKPTAKLIKEKRKRTQITNIRNKRETSLYFH